jgi:hypothetical protein
MLDNEFAAFPRQAIQIFPVISSLPATRVAPLSYESYVECWVAANCQDVGLAM